MCPEARRVCEETWPPQISRTAGRAGLLVERTRVPDAAAAVCERVAPDWVVLFVTRTFLTPHH